ncbi:invasin domain 3-containing protein, partial [Pseudomonas viridiflava]|uniref:invasin domain 3-containing protein n=1 Tax=Pseudomonas viridiflava TaxID=33069 RepID=UPI0013DEA8C3
MAVTASPTTILPDGISTSTISLQLFDANSNVIMEAGRTVTFTSDTFTSSAPGKLSSLTATTNADGVAAVVFTSPTSSGYTQFIATTLKANGSKVTAYM